MSHEQRLLRRAFLRRSGLAILAGSSLASAQETYPGVPARRQDSAKSGPSLSRQFARWAAGLSLDDLPPAVVDRAKGVTLQAISSVLLGYQAPAGREAITLMSQE